jgi:radical SAM protein with 4Fe4S-binding SPASM domain
MIYRPSEYIFKSKEEEIFPRMVQIALVHNSCNAFCFRCPIGIANKGIKHFDYNRNKQINQFIPLKTFKLVADNLRGQERTILRLHGRGEPLLHPKIVDMVKYAKFHCKIPVLTMFTNGLLLDGIMTEKLLTNGLDVFDISVDAFNETTYKKYRGVDSWLKILNNITHLIKIRNRMQIQSKIIVSAVLDSEFQPFEKEFKVFWEDKGVDAAILRPYHNYAGRLNGKLYNSVNHEEYIPCPQFFTRFSINTNGEVNLCFQDWSDNYIIGEIQDVNSIKTIWISENYQSLRRKEINQQDRLTNKLCKECVITKSAWSYSYELLLKKLEVIDWEEI